MVTTREWDTYDQFATQSEKIRWSMEELKAEIEKLDPATLTERDHKVLRCMAPMIMTEANGVSIMQNIMIHLSREPEVMSWLGIQFFDEMFHFQWARYYLDHVYPDGRYPITHARFVECLARVAPDVYFSPVGTVLVNLIGEITTARVYLTLADGADEPILVNQLRRVAGDEIRHMRFWTEFFKKKAEQDPKYLDEGRRTLDQIMDVGAENRQTEFQRHQTSGSLAFTEVMGALIKEGFGRRLVSHVLDEQYDALTDLFGDKLGITKTEYMKRQTREATQGRLIGGMH